MKKVNENWLKGRNARQIELYAKYKNLAEKLINEKDNYKNILIPWNGFFDLLGLPHYKPQRFEHRNAINKTLNKMGHADVYLKTVYAKGVRIFYDKQAVTQLSLFRQQREQSVLQLSIKEYESILPHIKSNKQKIQIQSLLQITKGMKTLSESNKISEE
jgi:hypothetical protein